MKLSIVMPCLNESLTLPICIRKAQEFMERRNILGEIIIADNGSTDGSQQIAQERGCRVVAVQKKGYGNALLAGINAAHGRYVIMGDSDDSYDFSKLDDFVEKLDAGYDMVIGNRFKGGIRENAMPFLHRYLGNPVLSFAGRLFYQSSIGDFHCGLRGFTKASFNSLGLTTGGMEFASEMIVKASLKELSITEVPIVLHPDGRDRKPHLRTWSDGWRHLKFLLLFSPKWLLLVPGSVAFFIGLIVMGLIMFTQIRIGGVHLDVHTLFYAGISTTVGVQFTLFYFVARYYAHLNGIHQLRDGHKRLLKLWSFEKGLIVSGALIILGLLLSMYAVQIWQTRGFGDLNPAEGFRMIVPAGFCMVGGLELGLATVLVNMMKAQKTEPIGLQPI